MRQLRPNIGVNPIEPPHRSGRQVVHHRQMVRSLARYAPLQLKP
jgi:hypothetical protein